MTLQFDPDIDKPVVFLEPENSAEESQLRIVSAFKEIRIRYELDGEEVETTEQGEP